LETTTEQRAISGIASLIEKLGQKAKREPKFRFYTLYGHLSKEDLLQEAWKMVKRNGGSAGIDNVTIRDIETSSAGVSGFLKEIQEEIRSKTYHPKPVKRVYIPKSDGKLRPLGIPTVKDRVVQATLLLIIEPIFEQDFLDCSYGFRPERSAHQAIDAIKSAICNGRTQVYDADLKGYFDSIPHDKLMKAVERRIADQQVLKLIRKWLTAPIWEEGKPMSPNDRGTPQGGVISPLLANIYLHWFDKVFYGQQGPGTTAKAVLVRYADDFVIMARYLTGKMITWIEGEIEGRFGLTINREKTKIKDLAVPNERLDFLGFTMRREGVKKVPWKFYCKEQPSQISLNRAKAAIREITSPKNGFKPITEVVKELNQYLRGWGQYFSKGYPSKIFSSINGYVDERVYRFLQRRSQRGYRKIREDRTWYREIRCLGVMQLTKRMFT
jgi:RNA-directed DNA polymerase